MSTKSERRAARDVIAAYHEARLAELLRRVGEAVDRFRAGELDAFDADQVIFQYSRAAKELWKFRNLGDVVFTARTISEGAPADWWERGAPNRRRDQLSSRETALQGDLDQVDQDPRW